MNQSTMGTRNTTLQEVQIFFNSLAGDLFSSLQQWHRQEERQLWSSMKEHFILAYGFSKSCINVFRKTNSLQAKYSD